jgi:hypothetical protein
MEDKTTYAVYWRSKNNKEWTSFTPWLESYSDAYEVMSILIENPACLEAAVVERTETFDFVTNWERNDGN